MDFLISVVTVFLLAILIILAISLLPYVMAGVFACLAVYCFWQAIAYDKKYSKSVDDCPADCGCRSITRKHADRA